MLPFFGSREKTIKLDYRGASIAVWLYMSGLAPNDAELHDEVFLALVEALDLEKAASTVSFSGMDIEARVERSRSVIADPDSRAPLRIDCSVIVTGIRRQDKAVKLATAVLRLFAPAAVKTAQDLGRFKITISGIETIPPPAD